LTRISPAQVMALDFYKSDMNIDEYCMLQEYAFPGSPSGVLQGEIKNILIDAIQAGLGVGAVTLTGGMGGDTAVDVMFAVNASNDVKNTVASLSEGGGDLSSVLGSISSLNTAAGLDAIYTTVQAMVNSIIQNVDSAGAIAETLNNIRDGILEIIDTVINAVSKWIASLIPDDAGLSGTAIRQVVSKAIRVVAMEPYNVLKSGISSLPAGAQSIVLNPGELAEFLTVTLDSIVEYLKTRTDKGIIDRATDWLPFVGAGKEAAKGNWKAAAVKGTASIVAPTVMPSVGTYVELASEFDTIIDFLDNTVRSKIPIAVEIFNKIISLLFGGVALLQVVASGDYTGATSGGSAVASLIPPDADISDIFSSIALERKEIKINESQLRKIIEEEIIREIYKKR